MAADIDHPSMASEKWEKMFADVERAEKVDVDLNDNERKGKERLSN